ncbi:hypothetical protein EV359DRAFT_81447 [Lentinula novae-zelandiae]|nr:hypothetical protein EV359DRAFT_81447 [Lentinula novae-zelandiae]
MFSTSESLIVQLIESQDGTPSSVIQNTVQSLINQVTSPETASSILKICASVATRYHVSLSFLIQQGFTSNDDGQSLLFQKVLQTDVNDKASLKILSLIMNYAAHEGKGVRICDIRRACIIKDDQALFEFVRDTKLYRKSAGSAPDAIYLGSTGLQDIVLVQPRITNPLRVSSSNRHQPAFTANLIIPMFQIRMRGLNEVKLEFIAQGRMWCLTFRKAIHDPQSSKKKKSFSLWRRTRMNTESAADNWQIGLSLTDQSESTPVQATITFLPSTWSTVATALRGGLKDSQLKNKDEVEIELSTKPGERLVSEPDSARIESRVKAVKGQTQGIYASLDSGILSSSGSIYIEEDGSLIVILEAILAMTVKPSKPKSVKNVQKTDEPIVDDDVPSVCL